ncbi:hypothetical protein [Deinococcus yavapaiensis]|uniref:Uncharacterized protein n=1 Tax=Deinococcus yavapaiensis KR-236 TaxID=694435 RepID=A0A318SHA7_9DEIO|nr:hypothetical protein [Deinococcus yavapaiensis]PYE50041.1 hypothetical protein DES52_11962 [Deinococcus yavapaiensis KR-236]
MTDPNSQLPDPADKEQAEGERPEGIPQEDRGTDPDVDPAAKEQAEGDRE